MRRIIIGVTAAALLITATAALAAANTYTATTSFSPGKAGSPTRPVPTAMTQNLAAKPVSPNVRAAPLTDIKTTIYGMKSTVTKKTPRCTDVNRMAAQGTDSFCPKGALVASARVHALLGGPDLTKPGAACNPYLHVWNAGPGKLQFFYVTHTASDCVGLLTGQTPAFPGTVKEVGKSMVIDTPLPNYVSTRVANKANFWGSLVQETLLWNKAFQASIGCKAGKRAYSVKYVALGVPSVTVTHMASCH